MVKRHVNFPGNTQRLAVILLLSFAAGHYKSYWSGCIKAAIVICQQIVSILALGFPFNLKIFFLRLRRRDPVLEVQFFTLLRKFCGKIEYWDTLWASFAVQSSTANYFVQALTK